jgi:hypothetical protein
MTHRTSRPFLLAKRLQILNSNLYAIFSLCLALSILLLPSYSTLLGYVYHLTKFYESIDIILFLLSGGTPNLHFRVHHSTTPILTLGCVIGRPREVWVWCAVANLLHHSALYAFFGGQKSVRKYLVFTGSFQLILGVSMSLGMIYRTVGEDGKIALGLYFTYVILYIKELRDAKK